jgi:hypothetical protein
MLAGVPGSASALVGTSFGAIKKNHFLQRPHRCKNSSHLLLLLYLRDIFFLHSSRTSCHQLERVRREKTHAADRGDFVEATVPCTQWPQKRLVDLLLRQNQECALQGKGWCPGSVEPWPRASLPIRMTYGWKKYESIFVLRGRCGDAIQGLSEKLSAVVFWLMCEIQELYTKMKPARRPARRLNSAPVRLHFQQKSSVLASAVSPFIVVKSIPTFLGMPRNVAKPKKRCLVQTDGAAWTAPRNLSAAARLVSSARLRGQESVESSLRVLLFAAASALLTGCHFFSSWRRLVAWLLGWLQSLVVETLQVSTTVVTRDENTTDSTDEAVRLGVFRKVMHESSGTFATVYSSTKHQTWSFVEEMRRFHKLDFEFCISACSDLQF